MGYKVFITIVRAVMDFFIITLMGLHVEGRENIPAQGKIIVAPNHKSDWDPPVIGVAFNTRIVHYMAKEELFKNPVAAWVLRLFGTFPVRRGVVDRAAIRQAIRELKNGHPLGIFPEGTRIKKDGLGRFHSGMASIALMTGTDILPVAVLGTRALPKKSGPFAVLIGKPVKVEKAKATDENIEALNEKVRFELTALADNYLARLPEGKKEQKIISSGE